MTALTAAGLASLTVPVPTYDRSAVRTGIVHVGVGGFHRAHEAMYVDRLLERGALDWGICGVGTQPFDRRMRDVLRSQDHLYTLLLKHPDGTLEPRVLGGIVDYLYAPDDPEAVIERMAAPETHIVSLTITEGGYSVDPVTGRFSPEPAVQRDLQPGAVPSTAFALVVEALARRRTRGVPPFTVLSCDNIQGNGRVAHTAFSGFASAKDPELGEWVRASVSFPSSMVDRITPVTSDAEIALVASLGVEDEWPVVAEPYEQWVLEDDFCDGRPPWEDVGVQLVPDVHPYELMKLRLLNAGHQAIGYLGYLVGHRTTDEVIADADLAGFLRGYLAEAAPTVPPVPGVDLEVYQRSLLSRFGNPHIRDTLARLCTDASDRIPTFLLPVVRDLLAHGAGIRHAALVVAAWARYAEAVDEDGRPIEVVDRALETVLAAAADPSPTAFLRRTGVFGDLADDPRFVEAFVTARDQLRRSGARAAVTSL